MKKILLLIAAVSVLLFSSCADEKTIDGVTYRPYGLLNESTCKNDSIQYEISGEAVLSGIIFSECLVPPVYVFGYNLYELIGLKKDYKDSKIKGVVGVTR